MWLNSGYRLKPFLLIFNILNISNIFIFQKKNQERAETFGLMTVSQDGVRLECEFRHLSLAEYLTALHVHVTGDNLLGKKTVKISRVFEYNCWRDFCVEV